jgi:anti-anti-sigma factor
MNKPEDIMISYRSAPREARREAVVLIADDDPHSIELIHSALSGEPIEITVSNDGQGTLRAARSGQPDIILLDVLMEGIDGFEICRLLKADEATREIPVIFMTSLTEISARVQAFRLGGVDYIAKPFERERAEAARAALQEQLLTAHQQRLRELSTPLIPITAEIMVMPLIGSMDVERAQQVMESVLEGAAQRRASFVILDVTGLKDIDADVAGMLVRAGQGLSLLGARVVITGIRAEVARALVELGVSLDTVVTKATLQNGVAHALQVSGGSFGEPFRARRS